MIYCCPTTIFKWHTHLLSNFIDFSIFRTHAHLVWVITTTWGCHPPPSTGHLSHHHQPTTRQPPPHPPCIHSIAPRAFYWPCSNVHLMRSPPAPCLPASSLHLRLLPQ